MKISVLLIFTLFACSNHLVTPISSLALKEDKATYHYADVTGQMIQKRVVKKNKNRFITATELYSSQVSSKKMLEKTIAVSDLGMLTIGKRKRPIMRPFASQYSVWLDGKEYFSQIKLNPKTKSLDIIMKSPEKKWQGKKSIKFPEGQYFCFFSQLVECIKATEFFRESLRDEQGKLAFTIIWDSYPYYQELYGISEAAVFTEAEIAFDGKFENEYRYRLNTSNQVLFYHFDEKFNFSKFMWISQGITITRR